MRVKKERTDMMDGIAAGGAATQKKQTAPSYQTGNGGGKSTNVWDQAFQKAAQTVQTGNGAKTSGNKAPALWDEYDRVVRRGTTSGSQNTGNKSAGVWDRAFDRAVQTGRTRSSGENFMEKFNRLLRQSVRGTDGDETKEKTFTLDQLAKADGGEIAAYRDQLFADAAETKQAYDSKQAEFEQADAAYREWLKLNESDELVNRYAIESSDPEWETKYKAWWDQFFAEGERLKNAAADISDERWELQRQHDTVMDNARYVKDMSVLYQATGKMSAEQLASFEAFSQTGIGRDSMEKMFQTLGVDISSTDMDSLGETWKRHQNAEKTETDAKIAEWIADYFPGASSALTLAGKPLATVTGMGQVLLNGFGGSNYYGVDPNAGGFRLSRNIETVRGKVAEDLGFGLGAMYQGAMSAGDDMVNLAVTGGNKAMADVLSTGYSFQSTYWQSLDAGATNEQATLMSIAVASMESICNAIELGEIEDNLTDPADSYQDVFKKTAKSFGVNLPGGLISYFAEAGAQALILKDNSDYNRSVEAYIEDGMSPEDAKKQASRDLVLWGSLRTVLGTAGGSAAGSGVPAFLKKMSGKVGKSGSGDETYTVDISKSLRDQGFTKADAEKIASAVEAKAKGTQLTTSQQQILDFVNQDAQLGKTVADVVQKVRDGIARKGDADHTQTNGTGVQTADMASGEQADPNLERAVVDQILEQNGVPKADARKVAPLIEAMVNGEELTQPQKALWDFVSGTEEFKKSLDDAVQRRNSLRPEQDQGSRNGGQTGEHKASLALTHDPEPILNTERNTEQVDSQLRGLQAELSGMGVRNEVIDSLIEMYDPAGGQSAEDFRAGMKYAFLRGCNNVPFSQTVENGAVSTLTQEQIDAAYKMGREFGKGKTTKITADKENSLDYPSNYDKIKVNNSPEAVRQRKQEILDQNKIQGAAFEQEVYQELGKESRKVVTQVSLKVNGVKLRIDAITFDENGQMHLYEVKSSQTASLTRNQRLGFPDIFSYGAEILGSKRSEFEEGFRIPPGTLVEIIRGK